MSDVVVVMPFMGSGADPLSFTTGPWGLSLVPGLRCEM